MEKKAYILKKKKEIKGFLLQPPRSESGKALGAFHHRNAVIYYVLFAVQSKGDVSSKYVQRWKKNRRLFGRLGHL